MKWKHMISVRTCKIYNWTSIIPIKRSSASQRPVTKVLLDKIVTKNCKQNLQLGLICIDQPAFPSPSVGHRGLTTPTF